MLLSGFTFIRNAIKYDFPIVECIESMLPLVDELIINVGQSEDKTEDLISSLKNPKIKTILSVWDDSKIEKGLVLSEQTNLALDHCQGRWALYLQADEALHEKEHGMIRSAVENEDQVSNPIDGFKFRYFHFFGGFSLIQRPWQWYASEIRMIRKASGARNYGDAQTFRGTGDQILKTKLLDAHVHHYGHARHPETMARKINYFHRFWHGDNHSMPEQNEYPLKIKNLVWFWGSHPACYQKRYRAALAWTPKPSRLMGEIPQKIVMVASSQTLDLAKQLERALIDKRPKSNVIICKDFMEWIGVVIKNIFSRQQSVVVDLAAESRSCFLFMIWILDALICFKKRIAHAPHGILPKWRTWFYTAINWGTHEVVDQGFKVPEEKHTTQLLRWLGCDV